MEPMFTDLKKDPAKWYNHFSGHHPLGMDRNQVCYGISSTFGSSDLSFVDAIWPLLDPDGSGRISLAEFLRPNDGLRDLMLAHFSTLNTNATSAPIHSTAPSPIPSAVKIQCCICRQTFDFNLPPVQQPSYVVACPFCTSHNQVNVAGPPPPAPNQYNQPPAAAYSSHSHQVPSHHAPVHQAPPPVPFAPQYQNQGGFQPPMPPVPPRQGRRKALLVGINYFGQKGQLSGCVNDVHNIKGLLTSQYGFSAAPHQMHILVDDGSTPAPTKSNILNELRWLASDAGPGDVLFFHYSGHGAQQVDPNGFEEDGMNETIVPVDFNRGGMISDDEIANIIVRPLPNGCKLVAVMDCCHSGTGLDLPFEWQNGAFREETNPFFTQGDIVMFSGCMDEGTSADVQSAYSRAGGAMTTSFCQVLRSNPAPSFNQLMNELHNQMRRGGFEQRPNLTSSQRFDGNRMFLFDDILPNHNHQLGRVVRRKFPPKPRQRDAVMGDMLGLAVAGAAGFVLMDAITSMF